ncbi:MAG: hypothetical protein FK733_17850 [Asgard group archaeon]|nr:hypothetical protein [Asgard group archaeon]
MKKLVPRILFLTIIVSVILSFNHKPTKSWGQYYSYDHNDPSFTTHQWLAWEALQLFGTKQEISWILNNLKNFWYGVEAPHNKYIAAAYDSNYNQNYGDIRDYKLLFDVTGQHVIDDSLATRAQTEYNKLVNELKQNEINETKASFYAGAMSHYISQIGFWPFVWNQGLWGPLDLDKYIEVESEIEWGLREGRFSSGQDEWYNTYFNLSCSPIQEDTAYNITVNLANKTYNYAQYLENAFDLSWISLIFWDAEFKNTIAICLMNSAEAIFAAIKSAVKEANLKIITIETPVARYDNATNSLEIEEFQATFKDDSGSHRINDSNTLKAEFTHNYYDELYEQHKFSTYRTSLEFNETSNKWYYLKSFISNLQPNSNHTIIAFFKLNNSIEVFSNKSNIFYVHHYNATIDRLDYTYDKNGMRELDVFNISVQVHDFPGITEVNESIVVSATWHLYVKGEGNPIGDNAGIQGRDTEGNYALGDLIFNTSSRCWYSNGNDIGLVYTPSNIDLYVLVRFTLIIPVGYYRYYWNLEPDYIPFLQRNGNVTFKTRSHVIEQTKPLIEFNSENKTLNVYGIKGWSDYNHTELDYFEMVEKEVLGSDRRDVRCKVITEDGIFARISLELEWSEEYRYWYYNGINVSELPDGKYYVVAKMTTNNMNFTFSHYGPHSEYFIINNGHHKYLYAIPSFFIIGLSIIPIYVIISNKVEASRK